MALNNVFSAFLLDLLKLTELNNTQGIRDPQREREKETKKVESRFLLRCEGEVVDIMVSRFIRPASLIINSALIFLKNLPSNFPYQTIFYIFLSHFQVVLEWLWNLCWWHMLGFLYYCEAVEKCCSCCCFLWSSHSSASLTVYTS